MNVSGSEISLLAGLVTGLLAGNVATIDGELRLGRGAIAFLLLTGLYVLGVWRGSVL